MNDTLCSGERDRMAAQATLTRRQAAPHLQGSAPGRERRAGDHRQHLRAQGPAPASSRIVGDRYYGLEDAFLGELRQAGVSFVFRIRNKPKMEVVKEHADRASGVTWQAMVKLGAKWQGEPVQVVRVEVAGKQLLLATDLDMEAELIALIYRWQVQLFFKWLKCILGCRHLPAEPPAGVAIHIYTALIAALMLQVLTGKKPGKQAMELIRLYLMGYVGIGEMTTLLGLGKAEG